MEFGGRMDRLKVIYPKPLDTKGYTNGEAVVGIHFDKAMSLLELQKKLNTVYGGLAFLIPYIFLVTITVASYGSLLIIGSEQNALKMATTLNFVMMFVYYFYALFIFFSDCQMMLDSQEAAAEKLAKAIFMHKKKWSNETTDLGTFLLSKYEKTIHLSPYSMFNLNRPGFLNSLAIIFTYLIVLLQFRSSET